MQEKIQIYGTTITLPEQPNLEDTLNYGLSINEQKWKKQSLPPYFNKVELDKNGDLILTNQQEQYASLELKRCKEGIWIWIGGKLRYISKRYYFYLQYYTLEDGNYPDFREADRIYFLYFEWWFNILWCLGIIRTKKRRQGASSQSCSNILYEAIFYRNSNCGLISKTKEDSKDTFTQMITSAYRQLPIFLKPRQVNKEDSVTELIFAHKSQSNKSGIAFTLKEEEGHNSKINYKAPVLNAYDRGRMSYVLLDEGGKFPKDVPTSQLVAIISKTLVKGVKRVGWIDMPSTTNEMLKGGGMEYFKVWKLADQFKKRPTTNRLVRFFQPAYEAYEGFIDEFGDSVIGEPTKEQFNYLVNKWVKYNEEGELISELSEEDIKMGAKHYVLVNRRDGLEGIDLEEEIRMNPCNEDEAFLSAVSDCAFNSIKIKKRIKELEENPPSFRNIVFYRDEETQKVKWRDINKDENNFCWKILWFPKSGEDNKFKYNNGAKYPNNIEDGCITVDSYSNSQGGRKYGSKASAWIGRRFDINDPNNTGRPIGLLYGRPLEKDYLHNQVLLAGEYYGYQIYYEHTADDYDGYFKDRGKRGYLGKYPLTLIEPEKREKTERYRGTPITPFSLTKQLDNGISFFENHCDFISYVELLENSLIFDPYDRTSYDMVVSFLMLISCLMDLPNKSERIKEPLVKTYSKEHLRTVN